ncbi:MAG TPA: hypothetical protein PKD51_20500, partial [Saprospiraceae bacterium]|nr:hypothetical protein [Saprospiraceae bacterium]
RVPTAFPLDPTDALKYQSNCIKVSYRKMAKFSCYSYILKIHLLKPFSKINGTQAYGIFIVRAF